MTSSLLHKTKEVMGKKLESTNSRHSTDDERRCPQASPSRHEFRVRAILHMGILVVVGCIALYSGTRWVCQTLSWKKISSGVPNTFDLSIANDKDIIATSAFASLRLTPTPTTKLPEEAVHRRSEAQSGTSTSSDIGEAITTDSEGTWYLETSQEPTDSGAAASSAPAIRTTTEIESLTDHIIISYKTRTKISTVTITQTTSPSSESAISTTTSEAGSKSTLTSATSNTPSTIRPTPDSSCPYATCASTCPWATCTTLRPSTMDTTLCQMLDPCFFDQKGDLPKPPSQGGKCACLCESEYCTDPGTNSKGKTRRLSCAEWDCCHECQCLAGNQLVEQSGRGDC